jgi:hypothetical protein
MASQREGNGGCGTIIAIFVVLALVVAGVISVAALVDPFSWLPSLGEIFGDCTDNADTALDECDLGARYPGFWTHVFINFVYVLAALGSLAAFARTLPEFREARSVRFESDNAVERYRQARQRVALVGALLAGVAALPIFAALA